MEVSFQVVVFDGQFGVLRFDPHSLPGKIFPVYLRICRRPPLGQFS